MIYEQRLKFTVTKLNDTHPIKMGKHWWRSVYYLLNGIEHTTGLSFNTREEAEKVNVGFIFYGN